MYVLTVSIIGIGVVACLGVVAATVCENYIVSQGSQARARAREQANVRAKAVARMQAETEASKLARAKSDMDLHMTKWDLAGDRNLLRSAPTAVLLQLHVTDDQSGHLE